ncbi:MAG: hypothetical protein KAT69_09550 [Candidatus Aminicenantes bacterium]|nr:hypothetical protein [Candidatus Aminicenantes bacterium]
MFKKLIYSPDDEINYGKGWYWQERKNWKTSQLFKTEKEAMKAMLEDKLKWN